MLLVLLVAPLVVAVPVLVLLLQVLLLLLLLLLGMMVSVPVVRARAAKFAQVFNKLPRMFGTFAGVSKYAA